MNWFESDIQLIQSNSRYNRNVQFKRLKSCVTETQFTVI